MNKPALATKFEQAEDSPGFLLWQLSNKWQAQQRAALKPLNLTHVQFVLLATLTFAASKNNLTQKQLAGYAQTDTMMTSQVIRKLEHKGLVERTPSKDDARAFTINPTHAGVQLINKAVKAAEKVDEEFFAKAGHDLSALISMMRQLAH